MARLCAMITYRPVLLHSHKSLIVSYVPSPFSGAVLKIPLNLTPGRPFLSLCLVFITKPATVGPAAPERSQATVGPAGGRREHFENMRSK